MDELHTPYQTQSVITSQQNFKRNLLEFEERKQRIV
jgi:hypothetical protein